jgi:hypothetical protein
MKRLSFLLTALLLLALSGRATAQKSSASAPLQAQQSAPESFAVVIGNNQSLGRRRPDLHYADDDAARYSAILESLAPGRVTLLTALDRDTERLFPEVRQRALPPTRRSLETLGKSLAAKVSAANAAGRQTELYFVFAGHGDVAEGEGFIELADGRFRARDLAVWLRGIPFTRAHVILDSCNSFFMLGVRKPGGRHFATSEDAARALSERLPNVGFFLSTSAEGEAFEWSEIQSGIFSHVVRSGLLGAADADLNGSVSYLELAAFVDTATAAVKNPNMRPHVFARGPGAQNAAPIARLQSMDNVRHFELSDAAPLRIRLRDRNGIPLLDAHGEAKRPLRLVLPASWAEGSFVERLAIALSATDPRAARSTYAVPEPPGTVTLALLQEHATPSTGRGPDETFQNLFVEPFGPEALDRYQANERLKPKPVYGVSKQDTQRMQLVLEQLYVADRGRRYADAVGGLGFGALLVGAGVGVLQVDPNEPSSDKTEARILGGSLIGLGSLSLVGSTISFFVPSRGEKVALEFRQTIESGGDAAQAFADADRRIREIVEKRRQERIGGAVVGGVIMLASATGLIWSEVAADPGDDRLGPRLGWSASFVAGTMIVGESLLVETPADSLSKIWRDDPSLTQYRSAQRFRPAIALGREGAFLSLSGEL